MEPSTNSSNGFDWDKIIGSLQSYEDKAKLDDIVDSNQIKEEAMNMISDVLERTKQKLNEQDD